MAQKLNTRTKLGLLQAGGALTTFAPLGIAVGVNLPDYVATPSAAFGLTAGGALAAAIVILQLLGKGKKYFGNAAVVSGIIFAMCILLEPLVMNLKLLTGMVFLGETGYTVAFKPGIEYVRAQLDRERNANVMAAAFYELNGRV